MREFLKVSKDKENDIFAVRFNDNETDYCDEWTSSTGQNFVIDIDKKGRICGIEIFDFEEFKQTNKKGAD